MLSRKEKIIAGGLGIWSAIGMILVSYVAMQANWQAFWMGVIIGIVITSAAAIFSILST